MRRLRGEGGALSVEFIAMVPVMLFVALLGLQLLTAVTAGSAAQTAARDGARAQGVQGPSCAAAVRDSLPDWLHGGLQHDCAAGSETVRVRVTVPFLFPGVAGSPIRITREATLPDTA